MLRLAEETDYNRLFPSPPGPLYQNEVLKCSAFHMEMMFHSHSNRTYFQKKSCALGLILKVRVLELGSGLLQCGRKQTSRTRASLHSDEASIQLCSTRIGRRTRSVWLAGPRLLESHRPAQRPTSTPTCHDQTGEFTGTSTSTSTHQTEEPTIFTTDPQRALSKSKNWPAEPDILATK